MWNQQTLNYPGVDIEGNPPNVQRELDEYNAKANDVSWWRRFLWRHGFVALYPKEDIHGHSA